jgi:PRC-barrel domain
VDCHGERIGTLEEMYLDELGRTPESARVDAGPPDNHLILVPLAGAAIVGDEVELAFSKADVLARAATAA